MAGNKNPQALQEQFGHGERHEAKFDYYIGPWDETYGHGEQNAPDTKLDENHFGRAIRNRNQHDTKYNDPSGD